MLSSSELFSVLIQAAEGCFGCARTGHQCSGTEAWGRCHHGLERVARETELGWMAVAFNDDERRSVSMYKCAYVCEEYKGCRLT